MALNRDTLCAIVLLLVSGGLMMASFEIREPNYGQLSPAAWPRVIVGAMAVLSLIYLLQSLRQGPDAPNPDAPKGRRRVPRLLAQCHLVFSCCSGPI